ncbi:hypothetical protein TWF569_002289 [Orbilia oligospora]|uniref:Uncharacterized protein n=1 Tax=Orbilia oligospora TaxID=2813651 RepID=A0A7C8KFZ6_ORBOL|nr:hypothetical protein TWF102_000487 [Orbilia oligospora]KAF3097120.1 hypothetical protein TWF103_009644 [Orbilia oligospora]KAF3117080.1 hypothetical protein TWF706_000283 [Orbilia oligospora]KAF3126805.1 hypothetical protein TWF703_010291 [Orbilia oligospora]KAF3141855.1 hypothetical protein TWF594_005912 [Orbilia oligospora]
MTSTEILSTATGLKSIKSAFRNRSRRRSTGSKASLSSNGSPKMGGMMDPAATAAASNLASRNYPHVHIKEMVYEACTRIPKHSYEESISDCTCGKRVVDRYREMCGLKDSECPGCKFDFEEREESDDEYCY